MQTLVDAKELSAALTQLNNVRAKKPALPILNNVLISANGKLDLTATDLQQVMTCSLGDVATDTEGSTTVDLRQLLDFAKNAKGELVELELCIDGESKANPDGWLHVIGGGNSSLMPVITAEDFPIIPKVQGAEFTLNAQDLKQALERIVICAATDDARPVLAGVLFEIKNWALKLVAADGFRLGITCTQCDKGEASVIVPATTCKTLIKAIGKTKGSITIVTGLLTYQEFPHIAFQLPGIQLVSRLIQGVFPNYASIVPNHWDHEYKVDRKQLIKGLNACKRAAKDSANVVRLTFADLKGLVVSSKSVDMGDASYYVECKVGSEFKAAFNVKLMLEMATSFAGDTITMRFTDKNLPGLFVDDNLTVVVMPMHLSGGR